MLFLLVTVLAFGLCAQSAQALTRLVSIPEAVDNYTLSWTQGCSDWSGQTGCSSYWFGQTTTSYYGGDAAQSGPIADRQKNWVQTTITGPGTLSFYWKVSCDDDDAMLTFDYNLGESNRVQYYISGNFGWQQKSFFVTSGSHTFKWQYYKNGYVSPGWLDAGWLDRVQFTPQPIALTVVSPNGGESWVRGRTYTIRWTSTGSPCTSVHIELLKNGVYVRTLATHPNDGAISWTIPSTQTLGTDYKIRVHCSSNSAITDSSNGNFAIVASTAGTLTVTSPNGGQSWKRGTTHTITWSKSGTTGSYVKIELLKGGVVNRVITSSTANDGSYSWTIPSAQAAGTDYKIRITSTSYPSISDSSNNNFYITT